MDHTDVAGKTYLITGASRGVGYALAQLLVQSGANVVISARGAQRLEESCQKLGQIHPQAVAAVVGDVANYSDAQKMVDVALATFGRLDGVVNNAGLSMRGQFADLSPEMCYTILASSLLGSIYVTRAAVPAIAAAHGSIVFISSIAGIFGMPGASIYCAAKGGMNGLAESLRLELADAQVHVGVAHLGFTEHDPDKRLIAADGSGLPPDRPAHHTQAQAAEYILAMIQRRKNRIVLTPVGKLGNLAYRMSPRFVHWAIRWAQTSNLKAFRDFS